MCIRDRFIYLEANRFRKSWEVSLDELKEILSCDKEETYKAFKRFNVEQLFLLFLVVAFQW